MGELVLVQGPDPDDPVLSLDFAKKMIHVDTTADDDRITQLVRAATARLDGADGIMGRALMPQTWRLLESAWPPNRFVLPLPPLIDVTAITYLDPNGDEQTLSPSLYRVVNNGTRRSYVVRSIGAVWPSLADGEPDAVRVTFDAGFQDAESPTNAPVLEDVRLAVAMLVQSWYDHPAEVDVPEVVASLIAPHCVSRLGSCYAE